MSISKVNSNMISGILKVIKARDKDQITFSISENPDNGEFLRLNITGSLIHIEGYKTKQGETTLKSGESYDEKLVSIDCPTTLLIGDRQKADELLEGCKAIFDERMANFDLNPAIDIHWQARTVRINPTNILVKSIKVLEIDANTQLLDDSNTVEDTIALLEANSQARQETAPSSVRAAKGGLSNLASRASKLIKHHF